MSAKRLTAKDFTFGEDETAQALIPQLQKMALFDVLINNAGISMRALFGDLELFVFNKVMAVDFYGALYCSKFAWLSQTILFPALL